VDYAAKTWSVRATYQFAYLARGLVDQTFHGAGRWHVRRDAGQTYLIREGTPCVLRVDEANRRLVPLVASMLNVRHYLTTGTLSPVKDATLR
jgi:hypothetical protein